jgi:hypothetical protein
VRAQDTGQPIPAAEVSLFPARGPGKSLLRASDEVHSDPVASASTDQTGAFRFTAIPPGSYSLLIESTGFVTTAYGARSVYGKATTIDVRPGEWKDGIVASLTPLGRVTGRVFTSSGRAIPSLPVGIWRTGFDEGGHTSMEQVASSKADDNGKYQIDVPPGHYYLKIATQNTVLSWCLQPSRSPVNFIPLYYPGVLSRKDATPLEVRPGETLELKDVSYGQTVPAHTVRGRIIGLHGIVPEAWTSRCSMRMSSHCGTPNSSTVRATEPSRFPIWFRVIT